MEKKMQENPFNKEKENKDEEIHQELSKNKTENEGYEELVFTEDLPIFKSINEIVKNHYGENLTPLEITKSEYSIKEIIDLGWIGDLKLNNFNSQTGREINYDYNIGFDSSYKYYKTLKEDGSINKIIGVVKENSSYGLSIKELEVYYGDTRLRFTDVTRELININDISKEILDLIPKDFGEYEFEGVAPYSNSLYFENKEGQKCRISDHRLPVYGQYTNFMIYNILIHQLKEEEKSETPE